MTVRVIGREPHTAERTSHLTTKAMHLAQMTADQTKTGSTMAGMTVRLIEMESNSGERTGHLTTKAMHLAQMTADQTKTGPTMAGMTVRRTWIKT